MHVTLKACCASVYMPQVRVLMNHRRFMNHSYMMLFAENLQYILSLPISGPQYSLSLCKSRIDSCLSVASKFVNY